MQEKMLAADPQFHIPPEVEVDPSLRKSHKSQRLLPPQDKGKSEAETDVTVILHQKPAKVRTQELKREISEARKLFRGQGELVDPYLDLNATKRSTVRRLARIQRPSPLRPYLNSLTLAPRPGFTNPLAQGQLGQPAVKHLAPKLLPFVAPSPGM